MTRVEGTERNWGEKFANRLQEQVDKGGFAWPACQKKTGERWRNTGKEGGREGKNLCPHSQTKKKLDRHGLIKMHSAPTNCTPLLPLSCSFPHPLIRKAGGKGLRLSDVLGGSVWLPEVIAAIFS